MIQGITTFFSGFIMMFSESTLRSVLWRMLGLLAVLMIILMTSVFFFADYLASLWVPAGDEWYWVIVGYIASFLTGVLSIAAGAIAKLMLKEVGIEFASGISEIDGIGAQKFDYAYAKKSIIFALDPDMEAAQKAAVIAAKNAHDSVGGVARVVIKNAPIGLGQPLYYKFDALLADAMMGINAVKAVEIGDGCLSVRSKGSQNNDQIRQNGFRSNHAGGILGGISNGEEIVLNVYFKPTPSIFQTQQTITTDAKEVDFKLKGRHDPCVAIRGSIVAESMAALVTADMLLLHMGSTIQGVKKYYAQS